MKHDYNYRFDDFLQEANAKAIELSGGNHTITCSLNRKDIVHIFKITDAMVNNCTTVGEFYRKLGIELENMRFWLSPFNRDTENIRMNLEQSNELLDAITMNSSRKFTSNQHKEEAKQRSAEQWMKFSPIGDENINRGVLKVTIKTEDVCIGISYLEHLFDKM